MLLALVARMAHVPGDPPASVARSISNPCKLEEYSFQDKSISLGPAAIAVSDEGGPGIDANARLNSLPPPEIAATPANPGGTVDSPVLLSPQATAVPSLRNARLLKMPPAIATTSFKPDGSVVSPRPLYPHATTVPFACNARL